ncbi:hypothetical protein A4G20_09640 [Pasteurellaceae bacterium RH1A]|nr:hypothetical protein A4G20_09640 [Pasteurellaceae bacterium RH1A]
MLKGFYQCKRDNDLKTALMLIKHAHQIDPQDIDVLNDMAVLFVRLEKWDEAIETAKKAFHIDALHINILDALSHAYGAKHDWQQCSIYGSLALQLRDREIARDCPTPPVLLPMSPNQGQNILSFSLYGDKPAYLEPAVLNAELVNKIYPGWIAYFYVDDSVPEEAIQRLKNPYTKIIKVTDEQAKLPGTMWRFLAMNEVGANYVLFRDADSVISRREAHAVAEWIQSGQRFHTIRDSGSHTALILAGLWGAKAQSVPDMWGKMLAYMQENPVHHRFSDQFFLGDKIWPYARQDVYASDRIFHFMNAHPIPDQAFFNYSITHIGCAEGGTTFNLRSKNPEELPMGCRVRWQLYSKIDPFLNPDLSHNLREERLICEYSALVTKQGEFSGNILRVYARGFDDKTSRISFRKIED